MVVRTAFSNGKFWFGNSWKLFAIWMALQENSRRITNGEELRIKPKQRKQHKKKQENGAKQKPIKIGVQEPMAKCKHPYCCCSLSLTHSQAQSHRFVGFLWAKITSIIVHKITFYCSSFVLIFLFLLIFFYSKYFL